MNTQTEMQPPNGGKPPTVATGFPDDIESLGDRLAALKPDQARTLIRNLQDAGIVELEHDAR